MMEQEESQVSVVRTDDDGQPLVESPSRVTVEQRESDVPPPQRERVHLPALLSDEFGISQTVAYDQIALGMVYVGGEPYHKLDFDAAELDGKEIEVQGRDSRLTFKMVYDHARHLSRRDNLR